MRKLFLFIIIIQTIFSCNGSIHYIAPAVTESAGTLVDFDISLKDGTGETYISIDPSVGLSTQESIKTAAGIAYLYSSEEQNCDIFINFHSIETEFIDGPSAGAAIALSIYSLINNYDLRKDTIVTGGIEEDGFLIPVGGIYEKALISAENNFHYLVVPPISVQEKIFLSKLKEEYDFYVVEIDHFEELIDFVIFNKEKDETLFVLEPEKLPELENYPFEDEELEKFSVVVADMISLQEDVLDNLIVPEGFDTIGEYYISVLNNTKTINEKGYSFTAANRAFLDYMEISTILNIDNLDLEKKKEHAEECLNSLPEVKKTRENFEWVISSELREYWAMDKLDSYDLEKEMLMEEKYFVYSELMYADAWCHVSYSLRMVALQYTEGEEIDESYWEPYADELISEAGDLYSEQYSLEEDSHLKTAKKLYNDGKYGASIYDSLYVLELNNADFSNVDGEELNSTLQNLSSVQPSSLWGKIYHTQGYYLSQGKLYDKKSALNVYNYAFAIDEATEKMLEMLPKSSEEPFCPFTIFLILLPLYIYK